MTEATLSMERMEKEKEALQGRVRVVGGIER